MSLIERIKKERIKEQIKRLEDNKVKLIRFQEMLQEDCTLKDNPNFQYKRYLLLQAVLDDLPEEDTSSFAALGATVGRKGYKSTWGVLQLDCHIENLKSKIS
jgi:hypothetical protein